MATTLDPTVATPARSTWKLDPAHSNVEFSVKHLMISRVKGRISELAGIIQADETNPENSSVEAVLQAATIDTRSEQRDTHLRSADFLDATTFPEITFRSTRMKGNRTRFQLTGDLTIRSTTREVTLDVNFEGRGKDPWGGERLAFSATGKIDRSDFGLTYNQALEAGGVVIGNDLKISIEVEAVKV